MVDLGQKKVEFIPPFFMEQIEGLQLVNYHRKLFFSILTSIQVFHLKTYPHRNIRSIFTIP